jgi:hypothetical protein
MDEIWKPIPGYPGYEASSLGRVRSFCRKKGGEPLVLSPQKMTSGYLKLTLRVQGASRQHAIHRLILSAFSGESFQGAEAAHLNGNRHDNRAENLAWTTPRENRFHKREHGTDNRGERHPMAKLTAVDVESIRQGRAAGVPRAEMAARFGVCVNHISRITAGAQWKGFETAGFKAKKRLVEALYPVKIEVTN